MEKQEHERARKPSGAGYESSQESRKDGNYSRRYRTGAAHEEARENREARKGASFDGARDRVAMSEIRKPSVQLLRLDNRLGKGVGAEKERAKLAARIEDGDKSRAKIAEEKAKAEEKKQKKVSKDKLTTLQEEENKK